MNYGLSPRPTVTAFVVSLATLIVTACTVACTAPTPGEIDPKKSRSSSATAGRWQPPESSASGTYVGTNGEGCSGGLKPGTKTLGDQLKTQFNTSYGGYACRPMNNGSKNPKLSVHAVGRALDITASGELGDSIANHLVENAEALGIQLIIWNRTVWMIGANGATSKQYSGSVPHTDHVHAEVTIATAQNGPSGAPTPGGASSSSSSSGTIPGGEEDNEGFPQSGSSGAPSSSSSTSGNPGTPFPNDGMGDDGEYDEWDPNEDIECFVDRDCMDAALRCDPMTLWCVPR
jgi:hypothetical protein